LVTRAIEQENKIKSRKKGGKKEAKGTDSSQKKVGDQDWGLCFVLFVLWVPGVLLVALFLEERDLFLFLFVGVLVACWQREQRMKG